MKTFIEKLLKNYSTENCNLVQTPMVTKQTLNKIDDSENNERNSDKIPFQNAIVLMYLASACRPDIAYAVYYLSQKSLTYTSKDWEQVKRIF